jgi:hypothetical protein
MLGDWSRRRFQGRVGVVVGGGKIVVMQCGRVGVREIFDDPASELRFISDQISPNVTTAPD